MPRSVASLLCAAVACAAFAAPAPVYKPDRTKWLGKDGWSEPTDPLGDCKFDRRVNKLTVTVPGKGHDIDLWAVRLAAPRLMRAVEGDFAVSVRVSGTFEPSGRPKGDTPFVGAGLLVTDGDTFILLERASHYIFRTGVTSPSMWVQVQRKGKDPTTASSWARNPSGKVVLLRLERRGGKMIATVRYEGDKSFTLPLDVGLPSKLEVGVFAQSRSNDGTFKPVFDNFELKPLK